MIVPNGNLLIYAYNTTSVYHHEAKDWWESCLSGNESVGLSHVVLFAFLRISTSTKAFSTPLTLLESHSIIDAWLSRSVSRIITPASDHMERVVSLLKNIGAAGGNLVTDAQIATLSIEHKATLHTADRDFMRFTNLKSHYPLS